MTANEPASTSADTRFCSECGARNGRTSKLIADFLLARAGIRPPVWREGDVMKHQDRWARVVREGVEYDLATVQRYYRAMIEGRS